MSIAIVPFNEVDPGSVRELLAKCWGQDRDVEFIRSYIEWRYGRRGSGETLVACDKQRCIGILDAFIRPYRFFGQRALVRETCDWYCLPQYRGLGIGLHLMRKMMAKPEPILVVGGNKTTRELLPRLKWIRLTDVQRFVLPVSMRSAAALAAGGRGKSLLSRVLPDWRWLPASVRKRPPRADAEIKKNAFGAAETATRIGSYDFAPMLDASILQWLVSAPAAIGEFVVLTFFMAGKPLGTSVVRLQKPAADDKAEIVHMHAAAPALIEWIAAETVHDLIGRGVGAILCNVSCPLTAAAVAALGFMRRRPIPVYWWSACRPAPAGALNLGSLQADDALLLK
jgi:hypothetical protein